MKRIFRIDVLDGDATVEVTVTVTTKIVGSNDPKNHGLARTDAMDAVFGAIDRESKDSKNHTL